MSELLTGGAVWGVLLTLGAFALGSFLQKKARQAWCNPLLLGSLFVILFLRLLQIPYPDYQASAAPVSYLLLPATVSLAVPLYEQWEALRENAAAILSGIAAGAVVSVGAILILAWAFRMDRAAAVSLLPKSVTTAIGADVSGELGGIPTLTTAVIILTGIFGNLSAQAVCRLFRIEDPVAKGVGIGTASHAIGTARALEIGPVEGAMSSLSIAVAGIMTALLCPLAVDLLP
ncbi:LrgB family protein [uncultured Oscillibacter sp.]|uniref:LrgB family protein n=1 Tax=uncultured Oscillibacter sp. TaxID=876091 RepID=UPI0025DF008F|nr:LrgB family protein [uncultured Oscillibacter sp.]